MSQPYNAPLVSNVVGGQLFGTTAGFAEYFMPFQDASIKMFILVLQGYENSSGTNQTITLPTGFVGITNNPGVLFNNTAMTPTLSGTTLTLVASGTTIYNGLYILIGV